jgi:hypothetical protein
MGGMVGFQWLGYLAVSIPWFGLAEDFLLRRSQFIKGSLTDPLIVVFRDVVLFAGELPTGKVREKQSLA